MNALLKITMSLAALSLAACASVKSYPDPAFHTASIKDIHAVATPLPVQVVAEFRRAGEVRPAASARLKARVERALAPTGVLRADDSSGTRLKVVANNVGDKGDATSVGIKAGLSLGFSGGEVTDRYEFTFTLMDKDGKPHDIFIRHALKSLVGTVDAPVGITPMEPEDAFEKMVQDAVLGFVKQYQDDTAFNAIQ
jgi:hypothetical protein